MLACNILQIDFKNVEGHFKTGGVEVEYPHNALTVVGVDSLSYS